MYIDDIRNPKEPSYYRIVRNSDAAIKMMESFGCPDFITFDHDLGGEDTSMSVIKWMIEKDLDMHGMFIPIDFEYSVHSANPVGSGNIESMLESYLKSRK